MEILARIPKEGMNEKEKESISTALEDWKNHMRSMMEEKSEIETRLSQTSRELRQTQAALNELNRIKDEFVSTCAHDLRSPVSNMMGFLDILREEGPRLKSHELEDIYSRMEKAGLFMQELINDLLDMVRIESGKLEIHPSPILLSQICKDLIREMESSFQAKEIRLSFEYASGELRVLLDPHKGQQILRNLLSNALKFTPKGGEVRVSIRNKDKSVEFEVRDSGPGIPAEEQDKLFQSFSKTSVKPTGGEKSSGLGLAIVKQLVDLHKGSIRVRSEPGKGTSFVVQLPVSESPTLLKLFSGKS